MLKPWPLLIDPLVKLSHTHALHLSHLLLQTHPVGDSKTNHMNFHHLYNIDCCGEQQPIFEGEKGKIETFKII